MINARAETVADRPSFRAAFRRRRCLVPADGYYEWKKTGPRQKQPYLVRPPAGGVLAFAGLWERWCGPDGEELESATIITTPPVPAIRELHDRMPLILPAERWAAWLDPALEDPARLAPLLAPDPELRLEFAPVSPRVNDPRNEGPENIAPPESGAPP